MKLTPRKDRPYQPIISRSESWAGLRGLVEEILDRGRHAWRRARAFGFHKCHGGKNWPPLNSKSRRKSHEKTVPIFVPTLCRQMEKSRVIANREKAT
jgi:hypothetical protein